MGLVEIFRPQTEDSSVYYTCVVVSDRPASHQNNAFASFSFNGMSVSSAEGNYISSAALKSKQERILLSNYGGMTHRN